MTNKSKKNAIMTNFGDIMRASFFRLSITTLCLLTTVSVRSQELKQEDYSNILKRCGADRKSSVESTFRGAFDKAEGKGKANAHFIGIDLFTIINGMKNDQQKIEMYKIFIGCIAQSLVRQKMKSEDRINFDTLYIRYSEILEKSNDIQKTQGDASAQNYMRSRAEDINTIIDTLLKNESLGNFVPFISSLLRAADLNGLFTGKTTANDICSMFERIRIFDGGWPESLVRIKDQYKLIYKNDRRPEVVACKELS